jgi:type II secretory pathway component PulL
MLELGRTSWQLHVRRVDGHALVASAEFAERELITQAEPIEAALGTDGYRGEPIVLALESNWCLAATLPIDRPQELRDRQSMLYRLEEWIPWSTEDFVADFLAAGSKAIAITAACEPLAAFVGRLTERAVHVQTILPVALLATLEHAERSQWPASHTVAFQHNGWIDLLCIEDARPTTWYCLPAGGTSVRRELDLLAIEHGTPTYLVDYELDTTVSDELRQSHSVQLVTDPPTTEVRLTDLALSAAEKLLEGRIEAPLDLKQGPFGRNHGNVALRRYAAVLQIAVAVLVLSTIAALAYRGHAAGRQAESAAARQAEVFRSVFPNTKVPVGVATRLRSELAKLKGLHGDDSALPDSIAAITVLERLLKSVPTDKRFRLLEIRIEEGRLYLDGEARIHSDAEVIAQRLRAAGFEASSPKTQRLDDGRVSLRITATLSPAGELAMRTSP